MLASASRVSLRTAAAGLRSRLPSRCRLFLLRISPLGMASHVFHRRTARSAGAFRALQSERIRSMAEDSPNELEQSGPRDLLPLEIVSLFDTVDDDDELCLARHAGYVSNFPPAPVGNGSDPARRDHCDLHVGRAPRAPAVLLFVRPPRTPPRHDTRSRPCG